VARREPWKRYNVIPIGESVCFLGYCVYGKWECTFFHFVIV